jgi:Protein of unknown function (DUF2946)
MNKLTCLSSKQHRFFVWIASLAILMAALAPSISQALAAQDGAKGSWIEICSSGGSKFVRLLPDGQVEQGQPDSESTPHTGGCPFCGLNAGLVLPSPRNGVVLDLVRPDFLLYEEEHSRRSAQWPWPAARSRAPPDSL